MDTRNQIIKSPTATPNLDLTTLWAFEHLDKLCNGDIELMKTILSTRPELSRSNLHSFAQYLDEQSIDRVRALIKQLDMLLLSTSKSSMISKAVSLLTPRCTQDFVEAEVLGSGGFGVVVKAVHKIDGQTYAIKKIPIKHEPTSEKLLSKCNKLVSEAKILSSLNSDYVVRYHNSFLDPPNLIETLAADVWKNSVASGDEIKLIQSSIPPSPEFAYDGSSELSDDESSYFYSGSEQADLADIRNIAGYLCLQMELVNTNLQTVLETRTTPFSREEIIHIVLQIARGLAFIHEQGIIHRDIKPANIFLSSSDLCTCSLKIGDFGLSRDSPKSDSKCYNSLLQCKTNLTGCIGTAMYAAPEQLASNSYDQSADIYSVGSILVELLSWPTTKSQSYLNRLNVENDEYEHEYDDLVRLSKELLSPNPEIRPRAQEIASRLSADMKNELTQWYEDELQRLRKLINESV